MFIIELVVTNVITLLLGQDILVQFVSLIYAMIARSNMDTSIPYPKQIYLLSKQHKSEELSSAIISYVAFAMISLSIMPLSNAQHVLITICAELAMKRRSMIIPSLRSNLSLFKTSQLLPNLSAKKLWISSALIINPFLIQLKIDTSNGFVQSQNTVNSLLSLVTITT